MNKRNKFLQFTVRISGIRRRNRRLFYVLALLGLWLLAPEWVYADNCSSLNDCYYTLRAALAAAVGLGVFAAFITLGLDLGPLVESLKNKVNGSGGEAVGGDAEAASWERSLGVVSLQGHPAAGSQPQQMPQARKATAGDRGAEAARTRQTPGARQPDERSTVEQAGTPADTLESGADVETPASTQGERPAQSDDMAQAQQKRGVAEQSAEQVRGADQSQGESRTVDRPREPDADVDVADAAPGRRGGGADVSGGGGRAAAGVEDAGDVADRAQEVSEAFGEPQESMAAGDQAGRPEASSQQAERPPEQGEPSMKQAERPADQVQAPDDSLATEQQASLQAESPSDQPPQGADFETTAEQAHTQGAPPERDVRRGKMLAEALGEERASDLSAEIQRLASVQGTRRLVNALPLSSSPAMLGALAEVYYAVHLLEAGGTVAAVADHKEGRRAADVVLEDGTIIEVKDYNWSGAYFLKPENVQEAAQRLVRQTEWLRQHYPGRSLYVAFTDLDGAPEQLARLLQSVGLLLTRAPRSGAKMPALEKRWEANAYWDALQRAGWPAEVATQRRDGLRALLAQSIARNPAHPWLALADVVLDSESVYELQPQGESYHAHLTTLARTSAGLFRPTDVRNEVRGEDVSEVAFNHEGREYRLRITADSDYIDRELFAAVNRALADAGEEKRLTLLPAVDQLMYLAWVSPETYRQARDLGLIPAQA